MKHRHRNCPGPLNRRSFLELGGLSVLGMGMSDYLAYKAQAAADELQDLLDGLLQQVASRG